MSNRKKAKTRRKVKETPGYATVSKKNKKNRKQKTRKRTALKVVLVLVILVLLSCICVGAYCAHIIYRNYQNLPEWSEITTESNSVLYDGKGNFMVNTSDGALRSDSDYEEFSQDLINAVLSMEDTRFYEHNGLDIIRVAGAALVDLKSGGVAQGASTITMQLARNVILHDFDQNIDRKIKEILVARQIEQKYSKEEILTMYLNNILMGQCYGMEAAAKVYFNKKLDELTLGECAMLAGVIQAPSNYNPIANYDIAINRRNTVLQAMINAGFITDSEANEAKKEEIKVTKGYKADTGNYSWFADYAIDEATDILGELGYTENQVHNGGLKIYTTMDPTMQKAADEVYATDSYFPSGVGKDKLQSAAVFVDPATGYILAMEGGREYESRKGWNRATDMKRQPGSVMKPLVAYGPAIEKGYSPYYRINDTRTTFGSGSGAYSPVNYDGRYRGWITLTQACKLSVNVVAVKLLEEIGVSTGWDFAKSLGLPLTTDDKNLSLALGGITKGVTPLNLATAYSSYANGGYYIESSSISKITDKAGNIIYENEIAKERVMKESTAYTMTVMLQETIKSGTGTKASLGKIDAAGKTGTTQLPKAFGNRKGNKDSWWAGFTHDIVGIVWMGFDNNYSKDGTPQYMVNVHGGQYPARVWKDILEKYYEKNPYTNFSAPSGYSLSIYNHTTSSEYLNSLEEEEEEEEEENNTEQKPNKDPDPNPNPSPNPNPNPNPSPNPGEETPTEPGGDTPEDSGEKEE